MTRLIIGLLLCVLGPAWAKNTYIVTVPRQIRAGSTADIYIAPINPIEQGANVVVILLDKDNTTLATKRESMYSLRQPAVVKINVPDTIPAGHDYKMKVKVSGGLSFDKTVTRIRTTTKATSIFIQTDKAIYKPGDLVQFRVFGTDPSLKVRNDPLDIYIQDPKNNRVKQYLKVKPVLGVFAGSFQLSTLTNLGTWTIRTEQKTEKTSKSFDVERVVLPKFEVDVVLPSFELKTDRFFTVTINTMYTFGKPVQGDAEVTFKRRWTTDKQIVKKFKIKGKATVRVLMSEVAPALGTYIEVIAKVTESITGVSAEDKGSVRIYDTPEKLNFSPRMPSVFKPNMEYAIILRATQHDDSPIKPPLGMVNITVKYYVPVIKEKQDVSPGSSGTGGQVMPIGQMPQPETRNEQKVLWTRVVQIPESGIFVLSANFPKAAENGIIEAFYRGASAYKSVNRAESPSRNYIQVSVRNNKAAKPGEYLPLLVKVTEAIRYCSYKVFSKGSLVTQGRFTMNQETQRNQRLMISYGMVPQARLLVYYARRQDGEIVADATNIPIEDIFDNTVSLKFNKKIAKPGEELSLQLTADKSSLVNVLAVDKSVLLLKSGNDITTQDVLNELQKYNNFGNSPRFGGWDSWKPTPVSDRDAFSVFQGAGVYVLTDAVLFQYTPPRTFRESRVMHRTAGASMDDSSGFSGNGALAGGGGGLMSPTRTRKNFPETWLWVDRTTGADGTATIKTTAPDTITEWVASAFAVNPVSGLGVAAEMANLTTFQKFFMRFELPFSAIRGEIIIVQATVFNYLDRDQQVSVKLSNNADFSFVDGNGNSFNPGGDGWTKPVLVKKDSVNSVYFPIKPTALGKILLKGTARSTQGADAVEREFLIEAEGIKQSYNVPLLIDLRQQRSFTDNIPLSFPPNLVKDSEFIKIQVIGDLLGATLAGLGDLLKTSAGSGEQNMVAFTPNVYVSAYLKVTNQLTEEIKKKTAKFLEGGYQRELSFVHNDGSFSAFGSNDKSGTTWLTAFVVKSFSQAADLTFIDINVMTKAIQWLIRQQDPSGAFNEPGIVIHKEMQGGSVSSKRSLTAFVLIALHEARANDQVSPKIKQQVTTAIQKATDYTAKGAPVSMANLYELAISFYALSLVKHSSTDAILTELEKKAKNTGGETYWALPDTESDKIQPWKSWRSPRADARALDVEMTSYVLLGYNLRDDTTKGIRVLKWLARQRNPSGGFISTQDTVIAVQALAGLGGKLYAPNFQMTVNTKGDTWAVGETFKVNNQNALVLQNKDIPNTVKSVSVTANGSGWCMVEAAVVFNVNEQLREPAFALTPTILNDSTKGFRLKVCFRWLKVGQSTMGILEISLPSGMEADLESIDTTNTGGQYKKVEKGFRSIILYFDTILSTQMCIEVDIRRVALVARHRPVPIKLREHNEPSNEVIKTYQSKALSSATIIEVCGPDNCVEVKKR
ncbi:CD109 antigen-like [Mytilus californianus]|uniref:CD109 antigen-like n=1 Tax=Mytilus californianus TaxID=6549 RepID=UPI0022456C73|nr:CD109 antigen-like [Mytilus californianus]XP_052103756.1 CD109 antigen-like [Mytilus californianus]